MLIEIDSSAVDDALSNGRTASTSRERIENLLLAHQECKHVVCIEKDAAARLESLQVDWSKRAVGALRNIRGRLSEIRSLRNRLKWFVCVGVGPDYILRAVETEGQVCIRVSLQQWGDLVQVSAGSALLSENLIDTAFYRILGEAFLAANGWRGSLCFDEMLGGGDTTALVLQQLVAEKKPTLAIVDSDKIYPDDVVGRTAKRAMKVNCTALQALHVLHVRDIENLIPSSIYEQAFTGLPKLSEPLQSLKKIEGLTSKHPWRDHADIKEGITLFDIATMTKKNAEFFWKEIAKDLQRDRCANPEGLSSCDAGKQNCHCYVTPALGSDALQLTLDWMKKQDRKRIAKLMGLRDTQAFLDLGEKIAAWGIAEQRGMRA